MEDLIKLDPRIRDWVLLPIFVVMVLQGIFRHYATLLVASDPVVKLSQLRHTHLMRRLLRFRTNYTVIPASGFAARQDHFATVALTPEAAAAAVEDDPEDEEDAAEASPTDPTNMLGGLKQSILMIVPNMLLMGWVSYFFSGFVLVKLPFPLAERFKAMLQRGIAVHSLDPSYVSALSWYFLTMFGLRGVYALLLGSADNTGGEEQVMMQMTAGAAAGARGGMPGQKPDYTAQYASELTEVKIMKHDVSVVEGAQYRILGLEPPRAAAGAGARAAGAAGAGKGKRSGK